MTIDKATASAKAQRQGNFDDKYLRQLLSELDGKIYNELMAPLHPGEVFNGYDENTPGTQALLAPYPYDSMYTMYLVKEIDRMNNETVKYNNSSVLFNNQYGEFARWWLRTHEYPSAEIGFRKRWY